MKTRILFFSAQFNCSDGKVLEMNQVCDGKDDCSNRYGQPHAQDEQPRLCAGPGQNLM